jgi:hypothetical protein
VHNPYFDGCVFYQQMAVVASAGRVLKRVINLYEAVESVECMKGKEGLFPTNT